MSGVRPHCDECVMSGVRPHCVECVMSGVMRKDGRIDDEGEIEKLKSELEELSVMNENTNG